MLSKLYNTNQQQIYNLLLELKFCFQEQQQFHHILESALIAGTEELSARRKSHGERFTGATQARNRFWRRNVDKPTSEDQNKKSFPCPPSHLLMVEFSHSNDVQNSLCLAEPKLNCHSIEIKHLLLRQCK